MSDDPLLGRRICRAHTTHNSSIDRQRQAASCSRLLVIITTPHLTPPPDLVGVLDWPLVSVTVGPNGRHRQLLHLLPPPAPTYLVGVLEGVMSVGVGPRPGMDKALTTAPRSVSNGHPLP